MNLARLLLILAVLLGVAGVWLGWWPLIAATFAALLASVVVTAWSDAPGGTP